MLSKYVLRDCLNVESDDESLMFWRQQVVEDGSGNGVGRAPQVRWLVPG